MNIPLTLNEEPVVLVADPSEKLLDVLRREKLYSVKCGCEKGLCGNCMVLMDGECVPSCIVQMGIVRGKEIVTLELIKTKAEYKDVISGFEKAGISMCGYCDAGKILSAYSLLHNSFMVSEENIKSVIKNLDCCCTDSDSLMMGIKFALEINRKRQENSK